MTKEYRMTIAHLFEHSQFVPIVANWIFEEFWKDDPNKSPSTFENLLREANTSDRIPLSLIAISDSRPIGTVQLIENDDENRAHLRPWLAALYVDPPARSKGVGSELVRACLAKAKKLNEASVYLGTDNPGYYERLGATLVEDTGRKSIRVMKFDLESD